MQTFLLHGGYTGDWDNVGEDTNLYKQLCHAAERADQRLLIGLCAYDKKADFRFLEDMLTGIKRVSESIKVTVAAQDTFKLVFQNYQVLFLQGSGSAKQEAFFTDIATDDLMRNKVFIGGSSAGASMICKHGYSNSAQRVITGKGLLDLSVIPHANSWPSQEIAAKLTGISEKPVVHVNEYESVVIRI